VDTLDALRALTEADRWIERVIAQREHLPELTELATVESELRGLLAALNEAQASAQPVRERYQNAQAVSAKLAARARDLAASLDSAGASARELAAVQHELEQVRARLSEAEDEELGALLELEPLDDTIAAVKERAQPQVEHRAQLQSAIAELRATLDEEIAALRATREDLAHGLDAAARQRYEAALARVGTSGAAFVSSGRCDGCRIALSPLALDRFNQLAPGVVMDCPECGRMLLR